MADRLERVEINTKGIHQVLTSDGVMADLIARADRIAAAAGPGNVVHPSKPARVRARVAIVTETLEAKTAEAEDRALTRAVDSGR